MGLVETTKALSVALLLASCGSSDATTQPDTDARATIDANAVDGSQPECQPSVFTGNPIYVSPSGNDSVPKSDNSLDKPWKTVRQAMLNAEAGDVVYFLAGVYNIESEIQTSDANEGSDTERIVFTNYENDEVTFTGARVKIDRQYWTISGINAQSSGTVFWIGKDGNADHFIVENGRFELDTFGGAGNVAPLQFQTDGSGDGIVRNCVFVGPGKDGNQNTAAIFVWRSQGIKILNNEFTEFPSAVYYKHPGVGFDTGIEIANNYFHDNALGIKSASIYATIHDNLLVRSGMGLGVAGGLGDDGANEGGDYNTISHNTFVDSTLSLIGLGGQDDMGVDVNRNVEETDTNDDGRGEFSIGATNNSIVDNVFTRPVRVIPFKDLLFHNNNLSTNLYPSGAAVRNNNVDYDVTQWEMGSEPLSLAGQPVFTGGDDPQSPIGFQLDKSSPGVGAASDNRDMGANVEDVGVGQECSSD